MNKCNLDYKRVLNKGKSFECSKWQPFITYTNDCIKQDFVTIDGALFVCMQTHLSSEDNKPQLVYGDPINPHEPTGSNSPYWEYVLSGFSDWDKLSEDVQNQIIENIDGLDTPDTEVLGEYVSSVMQEDGKLKIKRTALPTSKVFSENEFFDINIEQSKGGLSKLNVNIKDIAKQTDFEQLKNIVDNLEPVPSLTEITYNNLRILRNNGKLIPGTWYRIIDYQTTTSKDNTQAAGHQFDVIVLATDNNNLSHCARAIQHEGDTYFKNSNLNAWQLWYDFDNDVLKYDWANSSGKGVIYRMIDEFGNDCPYDFKNIQFVSSLKKEIYVDMYYTFSGIYDDGNIIDTSTSQNIFYNSNVVNNILYASYNNGLQILLCNLFIITNEYNGNIANCTFHHNCRDNLIIGAASNITFHINCHENLLQTHAKNRPHSKIYFGHDCYKNTILGQAQNVQLGTECTNNTFQSYSYDVFFSFRCSNNIFDNYIIGLTMGGNCSNNVFKQRIQDVKFSFLCSNNIFNGILGSVIMYNSCSDNIFARLEGVTIGRNSKNNNYSGLIAMTTIGGQHSYNIGTQTIKYSIIGANVQYNSFGIAMTGMNIGHNVNNIYFSNDGTLNNLIDSSAYIIQYSTICSNTCYTVFIMDEEHKTIQHSDIFIVGTENSMRNVQIQISDNNYKIKITTDSQGEIKQYCEADLIA